MNHLSGMDASFLHLETPETPMHVGGLNIIQPPAGNSGDLAEDIKAPIGRRLHLAGCKVVTNYPLSIPAHGMALNLTVQSYSGALDFGITACRRVVPDAQEFAELLEGAMAEPKAAVPASAGDVAGPVPTATAPATGRAPARKRAAATQRESKPSVKPAIKHSSRRSAASHNAGAAHAG